MRVCEETRPFWQDKAGIRWAGTPVPQPFEVCGTASLKMCTPAGGDEVSTRERQTHMLGRHAKDTNRLWDRLKTQKMSSVQFSRSVVSDSVRPYESQHTRPPCPSPTPGVYSNSCPSSQWCHPAISFLSSPSPPAPNPSQHQGLFQWVNSSHEVAKVLEFQKMSQV